MTDRPRVWTLYDPDFDTPIIANGPAFWGTPDAEGIHVIEWDREKVEAAIIEALAAEWTRQTDADMPAPPRLFARAIFDALDPEG